MLLKRKANLITFLGNDNSNKIIHTQGQLSDMFIQTLFNKNCDGVQTCVREKLNHFFYF